MNLAGLAAAVYTRLTGDATLLALLTGGVRHFYSVASEPENAQTPYAVFTVDIGEHVFSPKGSVWDLDVTITVSCPRTTTFQDLSDSLGRIYGDAEDNAPPVPTYGLHRWTPTLSGVWTAGIMTCQDGTSLTTDPDWYHYSLVFRCRLSRGS